METAEEMLQSPEFFRCRKFECTLKKETCIARQKRTLGWIVTHGERVRLSQYPECQGCSQGKEIARELGVDTKIAQPAQCMVPGCGKARYARGLCRTHYVYWHQGRLDHLLGPFRLAREAISDGDALSVNQ